MRIKHEELTGHETAAATETITFSNIFTSKNRIKGTLWSEKRGWSVLEQRVGPDLIAGCLKNHVPLAREPVVLTALWL